MNIIIPLILVVALFLVGMLGGGVSGLQFLMGVILPYVALLAFIGGVIFRVIKWAKAPVPFRIPTTSGQQKSLDFIKHSKFDNPFTKGQVIVRMALEVLFFRSLFRNTKVEITDDKKVAYGPEKILWLAGLAFHYTFLIVLLRHFRFFMEPVPGFVKGIQAVDGFLQIAAPTLYVSSIIFVLALTVLFLRRVLIPQVKYISLPQDYFPLFLILSIALSGIFLRYFVKTDITAVKELTMGLFTLSPSVPAGINGMFFGHLLLVCTLLIYIPMSKLTHMAGVFMSPTRNLANNNRAKRHINPWDYPVVTHPYEEYEDEFREKMVKMGVPVDKPLEESSADKEG
jgi:nitrate reductase gamma subunit